jgi:Carboxypeptidase regulatory-like domain
MKHVITAISIGILVSVLTCANVWAQATAQITGSVRDQSGAVLPGADVTVTQTETGIARSTITNETGAYVLPNLAVGPYRLEAGLPGFRTFVQTGIVLQVNSNPQVNVTLEVGQVAETVEVQANATLVETRSTGVGQVIENERILELPLNGRQATDLVVLAGAAVQTGKAGSQSMQGGVTISVAGGLDSGVTYQLDGAMHNNPYDGTNLPLPFPDALQEFKVEASGSNASNGMHSGGAVNAVTRSGTNEFHGSAFEFVRNYLFNARNFFAINRDSLKRNQFGGTVGGPIVKNKLFFFGGYQGTKTRSDPGDTIRFVPTAAMLTGDFSTIASPACNGGRQINLSAPFANNRIDPAQFSKAAVNIANKLPKVQDPCGKITYGLLNRPDEFQLMGRTDYQRSANNSIFGRYMATTYDSPPPFNFSSNILTTTTGGFDNLAQSYALGDTYLLGPNTINSLRMTVNRTAIHRYNGDSFSPAEVGINTYSSLPHFIVMTVTGGFSLGGNTQSQATFRTTSYQIGDDVSLIRGSHQFAFGAAVAHWRVNQYAVNQDTGNFTFTGNATGLGLADFMLGRVATFTQGSQTAWATRQSYIGFYGQDTWKMTPRVTVNYGLRWEPFIPLRLTLGSVYAFDDERFHKGIKSAVYKNAPAGLYFHGDQGFPENSAINPQYGSLAPRIGLAWDPQGDGRTSVRLAYGIAYDFSVGSNLGNSASAPPYAFRTSVTTPGGGLDNPYRDFPGGNPFPYVVNQNNATFLPFADYLPTSSYDMKPPAVQSWNLSLQRQITSDVLASASYIGSHTTHMWITRSLNPAIYLPGGPCTINGVAYNPCSSTTNINQRRRLFLENAAEGQNFQVIDASTDGASSNYNGLLLSIQRRSAKGVTVGGNYTWSRCIGDNTGLGGNQTVNSGYLDPSNRRFDRGNCSQDRRQNFNMTAVAETPQFANTRMRMIASGWRVSGIYRNVTGAPLTISGGIDRALTGATAAQQRANQVLEDPYGDTSSLSKYFNAAAFAQPALGAFGNSGRNSVQGPGTWQLDAALSRVFRIKEAQRLEFRAEAFNVTNSLIKMDPGVNLNANTFGVINSSRDARIMQFALKYVF